MAGAFSEPTLITLASGFEAATQARSTPQYLPTLPLDGPERPRGREDAGRARQKQRALSREIRPLML